MIISIIISSRNRCGDLLKTVDALRRVQIPDGATIELILVDNASTDDTSNALRSLCAPEFTLHCVTEPDIGKAKALNTGIGISSGDILVFTDDDVRPESDWILKITEPIVAGRFDMLTGRVRIANHLLRPWMTPLHKAWLAASDSLDAMNPGSAIGANMSFARRVLADVPGFDPELGPGRLGLWEDTLFSLQVKQAGHCLGMASDGVVEHHFDPVRLSRPSLLSHARREAQSSAYVGWHWKHEQPSRILPKLTNYRARLLLKRLLHWNEWRSSEGIPIWEMNLITGIQYLQHYGHESQRQPAYTKLGLRKGDLSSGIILSRK